MPVVKGEGMRGLAVFISDIRNCKSREAEIKRINKELANIRSKFKGDKTLDGYQKKKYVCKLLFIFLLGHDIDFGHMEAVNLLSSNKYTEKQIGYLFISVLVSAGSDLMRLVVQALKNDIQSRNPIFVQLALQCIANIGSRDMAESCGSEMPRLLCASDTIDEVKQSAALCLLRLLRTAPDLIPMHEYASRVIHLLNDQNVGVATSAVSLIEMLAQRNPEEYKSCIHLAAGRLTRIVAATNNDLQDYTYYFVPAPWLCVKLLKLLQSFPPIEDASVRTRLTECLDAILTRSQEAPKSKKVQHANARNAVLFEAINLIIHMDCDQALLIRSCNILGQHLQNKETNLRYLAMESMCLLAASEFAHEAVKKHQETVITALKNERDVSVRQRAVDLLYAMCDKSNAEQIVSELLHYLETADYSIREEIVLKIAILAEKYANDYAWYVDTILNLIRIAGDFVSEEVWYRVIQIVINREDVQSYAAKMVFEALQAPACHENMVKVGGYILGEFGNLIAGDARSSPQVQLQLLHSKFHLCSVPTRALLLSTYVKFMNLFPELKQDLQEIFLQDALSRSADTELQQRAIEYLRLATSASQDVLATVLEEMPPFPERESSILAILKKKKPDLERATSVGRPRKAQYSETPAGSNGSSQQPEAQQAAPVAPASNDLLGLGSPSAGGAPSGGTVQSDLNQLVDIFDNVTSLGGGGNGATPPAAQPGAASSTSPSGTKLSYGAVEVSADKQIEENYWKFVCKQSGVLLETDIIQVGLKAEYRQNLGHLNIFYGNKTDMSLSNVTASLTPGQAVLSGPLQLDLRPLSSTTVEGKAQVNQVLNVVCVSPFAEAPTLQLSFYYSGVMQRFTLKLPIMLNKFSEGTEMEQAKFFERWRQLGSANEAQKIFQAQFPALMDVEAVRVKLAGSGMGLLSGIDPNPENHVMAGIVHTQSQLVGCLVRLEPSKQTKLYRLTVRTNNEQVSKIICDLLQTQF